MSTFTEVEFADGSRLELRTEVAGLVRGLDADGDPLIPLGEPDRPILHDDGSEYLFPLTPCCDAAATGSVGGIACKGCYELVDAKYGVHGVVTVAVVSR